MWLCRRLFLAGCLDAGSTRKSQQKIQSCINYVYSPGGKPWTQPALCLPLLVGHLAPWCTFTAKQGHGWSVRVRFSSWGSMFDTPWCSWHDFVSMLVLLHPNSIDCWGFESSCTRTPALGQLWALLPRDNLLPPFPLPCRHRNCYRLQNTCNRLVSEIRPEGQEAEGTRVC